MDFTSVANSIRSAAPEATGILKVLELIPGVGTVAGGVDMALQAFTSVTKAMGLPADSQPDQVAAAIAADPQAALKMKQADLDYQLAMKDKELAAQKEENDLIRAGMVDTQDARKMHTDETKVTGKRDNEDKVFDWLIVSGFFCIIAAFMYLKPAESTNLGLLIGAVATAFLQIVNFRKGSTASGNQKTAMIYNSTPNVPKASV